MVAKVAAILVSLLLGILQQSRHACVIWLLFLINHLDLIGVCDSVRIEEQTP